MPLHWAATQNGLGSALAALGQREAGTARLEEAVEAFRAALLEQTRKRLPLDWATTTLALCLALAWLAERRQDPTPLAALEADVRQARQVLVDGAHAPGARFGDRVLNEIERVRRALRG